LSKSEYVYDSRDEVNKKHPKITKIAEDEGWQRKRLTKSHWLILPDGVKDRDCGDFTNVEGDGIVEFKDFGDFINTYTDEKEQRALKQTRVRYETGVLGCVIIYGSEYGWKKSVEDKITDPDKLIEQAKDKLFRLGFEYPTVGISRFVKNEEKAVKKAKSFLKKCDLAPREYPINNPYKAEHPAAIAGPAGFRGFGPDKVKLFYKAPGINSVSTLGGAANVNNLKEFIDIFINIKGLKEKTITKMYEQLKEEYQND